MKIINRFYLFLGLLLSSTSIHAQISVTNAQTPAQLVQNVLVGNGVTISNVEYNSSAADAQAVQVHAGYFDATGTTFPITEGLVMATSNVTSVVGPNSGTLSEWITPGNYPNPDQDVVDISTNSVVDQVMIEFDFVPSGDSVAFKYVFASDEYPEFSPSSYNDCFGFFISGPGIAGPYEFGGENIALLPTNQAVTINNVNPTTNSQYFVDTQNSLDIEFDGRTVVLTASANVQCGQTYHIKLAIADAGDGNWDSGVFMEANSFSSNGIEVEIASATGNSAITEGCDSALVSFIRPNDSTVLNVDYQVGGTATNGTDYPNLNGQATFNVGEDSIGFWITPYADALAEGSETIIISVEFVNACGDTVTSDATIEIVDPTPYNVLTSDTTITCAQDSILISADTDGGTPPLVYDWGADGIGQSIYVPGDISGTTTYNVDVSDACGQVYSGSVDVTLNPAPQPTITFNNNTFIICPSDVANIDATVNNPYDPNNLTYNWLPDGQTTEDISVSPNTTTWYYLTVNDGCYDVTDSVKVEMGDVTLTDITISDATNCPGQPGTPGAIDVLPDDPTWTYTLNGGGNTYGPQNSGSFSNLPGGVTYFLNVVSDDGCTVDTAVTVGLGSNAVTATWVLDSIRDVTCFGDNNGGAYVDDIDGGITSPYDVTWTHSTAGLHFSETVTGVSGSPADPDSEVDDLFGGQWVVTVTDQEGCAWSQLFDIEEPDELIMDWNTADPSCYQYSDGSVTINVNGGNGGYSFTIKDSTSSTISTSVTANTLPEGWYYGEVTDSEGCSVSDSTFIDAPGEIDIDMTVNQPACYGIPSGSVTIDTVYNYTGVYDSLYYIWSPANPAIPNGQGAYINNHLGPGDYTITINDDNGCSKEFDFTIEYPEEFIVNAQIEQEAFCRVNSAQIGNGVIYADAQGGTPGYSFLWTNLQTGQTWNNTTWGALNTGYYEVVATDNAGCNVKDTVFLDSLNPVANFGVTSSQLSLLSEGTYEGTAEVCIVFDNQSENFANPVDPNADTTFFWNLSFDPANYGSGWQISHDIDETFDTCFTSAGEHEICLVAKNKNGCVDTSCQTMIIYDPLQFTPVNVFTPNGDGTNDYFTFEEHAQAIAEFKCVIVDRWGNIVFEMNDITDKWFGKNTKGKQVSNGVYYYTYEGVSTDGTTLEGQGTVTLVDDEE